MEQGKRRKQPDSVNILVRLPVDAKAWLEDKAAEAFTSRNAQIVAAIRATMKADRAQRDRPS